MQKGKRMDNDGARSTVNFLGLLFLLFLGLKLGGVIGWSWWWVCAPLWGPFALFGIALVGAVIVGTIEGLFSMMERRRIKRKLNSQQKQNQEQH